MRSKKVTGFAAVILSFAVAAGNLPCLMSAYAKERSDALQSTLSAMADDYYSIEPTSPDLLSYSDYYDLYSGENRPDSKVIISGSDYASAENGKFSSGSYSCGGDSRDNVLIWESSEGQVTYDFEVAETGIYCVNISYCPLISDSPDIEFSLELDGSLPYDTASRITLNRIWVNEHEIYTDSRGNQIRPSQVQQEMWCERNLGDIDGLFGEPLFFYMEKGEHELLLTSERAVLVIESLTVYNPKDIPSYDEYKRSVDADIPIEQTPSALIRLEGENAAYKSDYTLYPSADNTNYLLSPADPIKVVYNTLGSGNWKKPLQYAVWEIPAEEIGSGGWYKIGIKARQDQMRGLYSNRKICIDGEIPCEEMSCVKFYYDTDWSVTSPMVGGEYVYVYLSPGSHTISLETVPGEIGNSLRRLDDAVSELNTYYRQILMITGPSPDRYTDYYVHEKIPGLTDGLAALSVELKDIQAEIESLSSSSGSEASILERTAVILDKCVEKPLKIPSYLSQIKDNITSVTAWEREYRDQPLEIDYIELASADRDFTDCNKKLGKSLEFGFRAFIGSFFEDYTTISDISGEEAVEVWVSLGRDQAQIIKEMTENRFIPEYGIPVSVNLVMGGVVEAALAGKAPDVALYLGGEFPVNLAARGLLEDVSQYDGFDEVKSRFRENTFTHYSYSDGIYGVPLSQNFPMLFYRTDILSELGFTNPPETWDGLTDMLPALQRNYMSVGLVLPPANISPATESGHTFALMLLQKGVNYYNSDLSASTFGSIEAVQAFEQWTDLYTEYGFEQTYDPFSRFRTGEFPIVIANYTFANQLDAASAEIKGLWDFCPVPGTAAADGTVSHAANSSTTGAVIFKSAENKENAWEYLKWFTSADSQTEYGIQAEGLLGRMGRYDTANIEALGRLSWTDGELERLTAQRSELTEIPIIPSSYAVTRNIMNAFRETVNEHENPRDTLLWYNRDINSEIKRKNENLQ